MNDLSRISHNMRLSVPRIFPQLSILLMFGTSACDKFAAPDGYRHIGTAVFRRSYAGHENWTESRLDSVTRTDPEYIMSGALGDSVLRILNVMGIAADEKLLLGENESYLSDTVTIVNQRSDPDTAYIEKDTIDWQMTLCVKSRRAINRVLIENVSSSFVAYLVPSRRRDHPFIAVIQHYYVMNGDNYEVTVYGKPDPHYRAKCVYLWVMSTAELRKRVIAHIKLTKDTALLRELDRMLMEAGEQIAVYEISSTERRALKKGLDDIKKGRVVPAAKANKAIEKWLSK